MPDKPNRNDATSRWHELDGEFDPGSGTTLAACLMHASRTGSPSGDDRGGRVRSAWGTHPGAGDNRGKPRVRPHGLRVPVGEMKQRTQVRTGRVLRPISWLVG